MSPILGIWASTRQGLVTNSYESISTVTVGSGGSATVTFSSIPSTYTHLQIRGITRNESVTDETRIRFNSDTGSNYAYHRLRGTGSAASATAASTVSYIELPFASYSGTTASVYGAVVIDILDYANTNKYKTIRQLGGTDLNGSGTLEFISGLWQNTNAITSISIFPSSGDINEYSQFALYGIKGA